MPPIKTVPHLRRRHFFVAWRKYREMTQEQVAPHLHMTRENLSKIERGEVPYDQDNLERLADLYKCGVDDLLTVDPRTGDPAKTAYNALKRATPEARDRAVDVLKALLK